VSLPLEAPDVTHAYEGVEIETQTTYSVGGAFIGPQREEIDLIACSCVKTARSLGVDIPYNTNAEDIKEGANPVVGGLALFRYGSTSHIGVIEETQEKGFWMNEGNFYECEYSRRFILWNDPNLIGFHLTYI